MLRYTTEDVRSVCSQSFADSPRRSYSRQNKLVRNGFYRPAATYHCIVKITISGVDTIRREILNEQITQANGMEPKVGFPAG
jgi:hypothetical protein